MPLATNQLLGNRYHILRLLGQGGMGAVYLVEHTRLGRLCAVKENIPDPNANPQVLAQMRQQFQTEAKTLAALDHPNLPRVYDLFEDGGKEYIVMEYVEGDTLAALVERQHGPLPERPVLLWADQVLNALEELHGQQPRPLIHRDIKPANIILTARGRIKLVDFGLVKLLDSNNPGTATSMKGMGTAEYAPLEQYGKGMGHTDARSDIYSLGATLYHLLTGNVPPEVTQRIIDPRLLVPMRQCNQAVSQETEAVILKAIEVVPDNRWQTAATFRQALESARPPVVTIKAATAPSLQPSAAQVQSKAMPVGSAQKISASSSNPVVFDWVAIPAGDFLMGSNTKTDRDAQISEKPQHRVMVDAYRIARTPVTNRQYKMFVDATGHRIPRHWRAGFIPARLEDHPVVFISWDDAQAFCKWAGVRLPTEAEWEKAARGTDGRIYPWGEVRPDRSRCNYNGYVGATSSVSTYKAGASFYGVLDVVGNVWEWAADWFGPDYYGVYGSDHNPTGPLTGVSRVLRGGSWNNDASCTRTACRSSNRPDEMADDVGFRCAWSS